jgi:hypothetical protein
MPIIQKEVNLGIELSEIWSTQAASEVPHVNCITRIYSRKALFVEKKKIPKKRLYIKHQFKDLLILLLKKTYIN